MPETIWQQLARSFFGHQSEISAEETEPKGTSANSAAPPGIVIWDLENCTVPTRLNQQLPLLVKALRSAFRASRVVTAAEIPTSDKGTVEQLRALSYCDVEVLTFLRPDKAASSAKKHSSADYMLKRVCCMSIRMRGLDSSNLQCILTEFPTSQALQRFLSSPCTGSRVTLISSDADFKSDIHHAQVLVLLPHPLL